jgi:hypothetical protein
MEGNATPRVVGTHAPQVVGIQHRSPRGEATEPWSTFDHHCAVDRLRVQVQGDRVELMLFEVGHQGQGVGLQLPKDLAVVVGHFLLAGAQGDVTTATAALTPR